MKTVVLYGNSLVVSILGASLKDSPGLQLVQVDASEPGVSRQLSDIRPDIVIFDLATEHTDFAVNLWKALPDLLLIGVRPDISEMLVLSSRQQQVLCQGDLLSIIYTEARV